MKWKNFSFRSRASWRKSFHDLLPASQSMRPLVPEPRDGSSTATKTRERPSPAPSGRKRVRPKCVHGSRVTYRSRPRLSPPARAPGSRRGRAYRRRGILADDLHPKTTAPTIDSDLPARFRPGQLQARFMQRRWSEESWWISLDAVSSVLLVGACSELGLTEPHGVNPPASALRISTPSRAV